MLSYSNPHTTITVYSFPGRKAMNYVHCINKHELPLVREFYVRYSDIFPLIWQEIAGGFNNWTTMYEISYILESHGIQLYSQVPAPTQQTKTIKVA